MTNNTITSPKGFLATGVHYGVKKPGELDLGLIACRAGALSNGLETIKDPRSENRTVL